MFSYRVIKRKGVNMITVKEYADKNGVTAQSVYKRINSKKLKDRLKGHIVIEYGVKCLDDVAIEILNETKKVSTNTLSVVKNKENKEELEKLKEENTRLKDELIAKQNKYENVLEQLLIAQKQIADKEKQLLEYQSLEKEKNILDREEKKTREPEPEPDKTEPENHKNEVKKGNWFTRLFKR